MINSRVIFFLLFIFPSYLISQTFLDRLNVPIYITSSLSAGYDTNIFRLSDFERNFEFQNSIPIINSNTFDDGYITPKISINYSPHLISKIKTQLNFSLLRNHYFDTNDKSYNIIFTELGFKLASYRWLKFSHRYLPKYYLRNYIDHDSNNSNYSECIFSSESFGVSFSNPIIKKVWARAKYIRTNLYYNIDFTEYDTVIDQFSFRVNSSYFKMNNSLWLSYAIGENISYGSGYESSLYDRSYKEYTFGYSANKKIKLLSFIDRLGISSVIKNRIYSEESLDDPIHAGREHIEYNWSLWIEKKLSGNLSHQFKLKYRDRDVFSDFSANYFGGTDIAHMTTISDLKSFEKFEFIYKIVFNTHLDFLF
tara:strand:+ start:506 stop:1603 length:1098 start_codon:yes stop_codon:yes gene_type:complete